MTTGSRIGIDLGGTKIEALALDSDGNERSRLRIATPPDYAGTIEAVVGLVEATTNACGTTVDSIGVGIPGNISQATGLVKNANSTWLIGHPFDADLADALGRPVRMMNDADCFALSEATDGAGAGARIVFGVILGTGVGGGLVIDGMVVEGTQGIAGEWGHNPLPWPEDDERPGPECFCGQRGCIETFLAGPGMVRDHEAVTGEELTTYEIVERSLGGDAEALATINRYVGRLARGLATVINVVDPNVVVLGGGMSNLPGLAESVSAALPAWVFSDEMATRVVKNLHGDSSGVRGAAWLGGVD